MVWQIDLCPQLIPKTGKAPSQATNLAKGRETTKIMVHINIPDWRRLSLQAAEEDAAIVPKRDAADRMQHGSLDAGGCHLKQEAQERRQHHKREHETIAVKQGVMWHPCRLQAMCCGVSVDLEAVVVAIRYHTRSNQQEKLQGFRAGQNSML